RDGAQRQYGVMKSADVELRAEGLLGLGPRLEDRSFTQVEGQRLRGPCDVAIHLGFDLMLGQRGVLTHIGESAITRPTLGVDASVDDEAHRTPDLVAQHPEAVVWSLVHPHFRAEVLTVE